MMIGSGAAGERVVVVGLGAWGSAAAWQLARDGHAVVAIDRHDPPHPFGSTHGHSRAFRRRATQASEARLLALAETLYQELQRSTGRALFTAVDGLWLFDDEALLRRTIAGYASADAPCDLLDAGEVRHRWPALRAEEGEVALFETTAAVIEPEECVRAQLELAARAGATLRTGERVLSWEATDDRVVVTSDRSRLEADRLVLCAGPWSGELARLAVPLPAERQVFIEIPGRFDVPVAAFSAEPPYANLYFHPQPDALKVALHHGGARGRADDLSRAVAPEDVAAIRRELRRRAPAFDGDPRAAATCLYTDTPDDEFVIGPHPEHPNVIVLAGCNGGGMRVAPGIGRLAADLCGSGSTIDLTPWDPLRRGLVAGVPGR
jgi:glycine/D-amino acid oxidase-like deaminating enzyme